MLPRKWEIRQCFVFQPHISFIVLQHYSLRKSDWLSSGNALIQWVKNAIFVFPALPGSVDAQVMWGGTVKRLLIAYFIGNMYAKKYQNPFTCVEVIASRRRDVFWDTVKFILSRNLVNRINITEFMIVQIGCIDVAAVNVHCHLLLPEQWSSGSRGSD